MSAPRYIPVAAALLVAALLAPRAAAQEVQRVDVVVTSAAGTSIYLDKGRNHGLAIGTPVRLFAPGGPVDVEVRAVTATSARAELPPGVPPPPSGTRGQAEVRPGEQPPPQEPPPQKPQNVDHPPWTRREGEHDPDQPLLAPAFGRQPSERPIEIDGRLFSLMQWNRDMETGRESDYYLGRLGADLQVRNPFGDGGRVQFAGEVDRRNVDVKFGTDSSDTEGRIDLLSYAIGDEQYAPLRVEAGRFFSDAAPELGLFDGVETIAQFGGGWRLGGGVGSYPLPFPARDTGADLGLHAFVEYVEPEGHTLSWVAGAQKTWHHGAPDRDLLLGRVQYNPAGPLWLFGNAKVDFYTAKDNLKPAVELTEAMVQVRADGAEVGGGVTASRFLWPQLLREEYRALPPALVQFGHVDRVGGDVWYRPRSDLRVAARLDSWRDQDGDGLAYDLSADWNDWLGSGANLYLAYFESSGSFYGGPGWRARLRRQVGGAWLSLGYQRHQYTTTSLLGGEQTFVRQSVDGSVDYSFGNTDLSLSAERWFGDQEDAFAVTLYVQYRF